MTLSSSANRSSTFVDGANKTDNIYSESRINQYFNGSSNKHLLQQQKKSWFSSYPPHEVVGLPALSPVSNTHTHTHTLQEFPVNQGAIIVHTRL